MFGVVDDIEQHQTSFIYAPDVGHFDHSKWNHHLGQHNMLNSSRHFDCSTGSSDARFDVCKNNEEDTTTRFWSDIVIENAVYEKTKTITNEGQKVILSVDPNTANSTVEITPENADAVITIAVTKQTSHKLQYIDGVDMRDWETTGLHCPGGLNPQNLGPTGPMWQPNTFYQVGDHVIFDAGSNVEYVCNTDHDSSNSNDPTDIPPGYWRLGKTPGGTWITEIAYNLGDIVEYDGVEFVCIESHVSSLGEEPLSAPEYWCQIVDSGVGVPWETCRRYVAGDVAFYKNGEYECIADHVSYPTVEPINAPNYWSEVNRPDPWEESVLYEVGDVVEYLGITYVCIQSHTSQGDWAPVTVPSLWNVVVDGGSPWTAWVQYYAGDIVPYNGNTYECLLTHVSQPTWAPPLASSIWRLIP